MLPLVIRNYERGDFANLIALQEACFPPPFPSELWWSREQLLEHVTRFPDGALCAELQGRIVGSMTSLRVTLNEGEAHSWASVTDNGYIRNHEPNGDTVYVVDLCVAPEYRKIGIGKWLLQSMYETVVHLGCRRLLGGGRMPGYQAHSERNTPQEYVERVLTGELFDPVISFMLRCGRQPAGIASEYVEDEQSLNYAVLMEWRNPFKVER
jgi:ribosomal protein S18 acetylase RimI-like enzyme